MEEDNKILTCIYGFYVLFAIGAYATLVPWWTITVIVFVFLVICVLLFPLLMLAWGFSDKFRFDMPEELQQIVKPFYGSDYVYRGITNRHTYSSVTFTKGRKGKSGITIRISYPLFLKSHRVDIATTNGDHWSFKDVDKDKAEILQKIEQLIKTM